MAETLSIGRWHGLRATSLDQEVFTILAFDQRGSYRKMLPEGTSYTTAVEIKREVVVALSPQVSAVLLDPTYGLPAALEMSRRSGLLMALEKSGYSGDPTDRHVEFEPNWTVAKIKKMGAAAVKLLVYYHPHSGKLAEEIESIVKNIVDESHHHDLPLFLEPLSYALDADMSKEDFARSKPSIVAETARRLSQLKPDVLKMEFPVDVTFEKDQKVWRAACEAISQATSVPWVLLSAGVDYETFAQQTLIACQAGASGFLAGRAIWKEAVTMTPQQRQTFLTTTAQERLRQLTEITVQHARPWRDFYTMPECSENWFQNYPEK